MSNARQEAIKAIAGAKHKLNYVDFKTTHVKDLFGVNVFNAAGTAFLGATGYVIRKSSLLAALVSLGVLPTASPAGGTPVDGLRQSAVRGGGSATRALAGAQAGNPGRVPGQRVSPGAELNGQGPEALEAADRPRRQLAGTGGAAWPGARSRITDAAPRYG